MLSKIQCLTPDGEGGQTRTHLALSMHTMRGARGNYLASAIRQKWAEGCDFRVSYGLIGFRTKQILGAATARGRIPLRSTGLDYHPDDDFDLNNDGEDDVILNYYTHQKYFVIQGTYNGVPNTNMVLTGSSNWASLGTAKDEIFFTIQGRTTPSATWPTSTPSGTAAGSRATPTPRRTPTSGSPGRSARPTARTRRSTSRCGARSPRSSPTPTAPAAGTGKATDQPAVAGAGVLGGEQLLGQETTVSWSRPTTTAAVSESPLATPAACAAVDVHVPVPYSPRSTAPGRLGVGEVLVDQPSADSFDWTSVTAAPFGSVRWTRQMPPRLGEYVADDRPAGRDPGGHQGREVVLQGALDGLVDDRRRHRVAALRGESLAAGEAEAEAVADGDVDVLGAPTRSGRPRWCRPRRRCRTPPSEAARASPAMATGIRVMRQVCLVLPTRS